MPQDSEPAPARVPTDDAAGTSSPRRRRALPLALLVEARPKQWAKNVLVFAAPGAAAVLTQRTVFLQASVAFVAFCLAASGTYYLNDAGDVAADRLHPTKRFRPIAAGEIPVPLAQFIGGLLIAAGVAISFLAHWQLAVVIVVYVLLTTLYTVWLKHVVVFDVVAVASGFVLRGSAERPPPAWRSPTGSSSSPRSVRSSWWRASDTPRHASSASANPRPVPRWASTRSPTSSTCDRSPPGVVLVAYCLWAFEKADAARLLHHQTMPWFQLSIVPFGIAILRYALLVDQGHGGAPEEVVLSDRVLQGVGVVWIIIFAIGLHYG